MTNDERLALYDRLLGECMPPDFKDWWENSPDEWPEVAAQVIRGLRARVKGWAIEAARRERAVNARGER